MVGRCISYIEMVPFLGTCSVFANHLKGINEKAPQSPAQLPLVVLVHFTCEVTE